MQSPWRRPAIGLLALTFIAGAIGAARAEPVLIFDIKSRTLQTDGNPEFKTLGKKDATLPYDVTIDDKTTKWTVSLQPPPEPDKIFLAAPDALASFKKVLETMFPKWDFIYTGDQGADLKLSEKSLVVHSYTATNKTNLFDYKLGLAGAEIDIEYAPHGDDPTGDDVHWIQVIKDNHALGRGGGHGVDENVVDNKGSKDDPYYDSAFSAAADSTFFDDTPTRENYQSHNWLGEVFLVEEVNDDNGHGGRTVKIYDGVVWGWINRPVPVPEPPSAALVGIGGLLLGASRWRCRRWQPPLKRG